MRIAELGIQCIKMPNADPQIRDVRPKDRGLCGGGFSGSRAAPIIVGATIRSMCNKRHMRISNVSHGF
jgi:hypothetical protein